MLMTGKLILPYVLVGLFSYIQSDTCEFSVQDGCLCTSDVSLIKINCKFEPLSNLTGPLITSVPSQKVVIQVLDLSHNNLTHLPTDFFKSVLSVTMLDLSYNSFTASPPLLDIMKNVTVLNLSHNLMTSLDSSVLNEKSPVQTLDLSHNQIRRIEVADNHTLQLYILNLSNNLIRDVPDVIWKAADSLHLSDNFISSLPVIPESKIKYMILSGNQLTSIQPKTFSQLHFLDELYLSNNRLESIMTTSFAGAWALTEINLENNIIVNIEDGVFKSLPNLITINMAQNKLTRIGKNYFNGLEDNLQWLSLKGNEISNISLTAFTDLENLRHLDLSSNPTLGDINAISFPPHLASLDLSNCNLLMVDDCKFAMYRDLQFLGLSGNNLTCSCQLSWLYRWQLHVRQNKFVSTNTSLPHWNCLDSKENLIKVNSDLTQCTNMTQHMHHCHKEKTILIDPNSVNINLTVSTSHDVITAVWSMESDHPIHGFIVTYQTKDDTKFESPLLRSTTTKYIIRDTEVKGSYTVCVHALYNETYTIKKECKVKDTDVVQMIVGIMAGIVFLIPCVLAFVYILYKDRKIMKEYDYLSEMESTGDNTSEITIVEDVNVSDKVTVVVGAENDTPVLPTAKDEFVDKSQDSPSTLSRTKDDNSPDGSFRRNEAFVADCGKSHSSSEEFSSEICDECHQTLDNSDGNGHFLTKL